MTTFHVSDLFKIPLSHSLKGWRSIAKEEALEKVEKYINKKGCYVFSIKVSKGCVPIYVGKSEKCIVREAFNDRNLRNVDKYINDKKGTLIIQFVHEPPKRGKHNAKAIDQLESVLVSSAANKNPDLVNIRKRDKDLIIIKGVINNGPGKPTESEVLTGLGR